jgi:hypothetical protein
MSDLKDLEIFLAKQNLFETTIGIMEERISDICLDPFTNNSLKNKVAEFLSEIE